MRTLFRKTRLANIIATNVLSTNESGWWKLWFPSSSWESTGRLYEANGSANWRVAAELDWEVFEKSPKAVAEKFEEPVNDELLKGFEEVNADEEAELYPVNADGCLDCCWVEWAPAVEESGIYVGV